MREKNDPFAKRQDGKRRSKCLLLIATVLLCSCATVSSLPQSDQELTVQGPDAPPHASSRVYEHPYFRVFTVASLVLHAQDFSVDKENRGDHVILASGPTQAFGDGPLLGLYFRELGADKTLVETIETRRLASRFEVKRHAPMVLDAIEKQLSSLGFRKQ